MEQLEFELIAYALDLLATLDVAGVAIACRGGSGSGGDGDGLSGRRIVRDGGRKDGKRE